MMGSQYIYGHELLILGIYNTLFAGVTLTEYYTDYNILKLFVDIFQDFDLQIREVKNIGFLHKIFKNKMMINFKTTIILLLQIREKNCSFIHRFQFYSIIEKKSIEILIYDIVFNKFDIF